MINGPWEHQGPFYWHDLNLIPVWIIKYIHYEVWHKINQSQTCVMLAKQFHPTIYSACDYLSNLGLTLHHVTKGYFWQQTLCEQLTRWVLNHDFDSHHNVILWAAIHKTGDLYIIWCDVWQYGWNQQICNGVQKANDEWPKGMPGSNGFVEPLIGW